MFGDQFFYSHNLMTDNNKDQRWPRMTWPKVTKGDLSRKKESLITIISWNCSALKRNDIKIRWKEVPSSVAEFNNFSETNSCFFASRNVVQNEPSLDSKRKTYSTEFTQIKWIWIVNVWKPLKMDLFSKNS